MKLFTIGFTQKSAKHFFQFIKENKIEILIDIRLNNVSQLAGFAKGEDLKYFLKELCNCSYEHNVCFAPTKELLDGYRKKDVSWNQYEAIFKDLIKKRKMIEIFKEKYSKYQRVCLLCSEPEPEKCHRRLLAEAIKDNDKGVEVIHGLSCY